MSLHKFIMALTLLGAVLLVQAPSAFGAGDPLDALAPKSVVNRGTWGGYRKTDIIAARLPLGVHTVRVTLLKSHSAGSTGHQFCLLGLGAAGITTHGKGMIQ